jgi:hypothetical protein
MVPGDRLRGALERWQTGGKPPRGWEAGAPQGWDAVLAHGPWVSWASLLLPRAPPGLSPGPQRRGDTPRALQHGLADTAKRPSLQPLTPIDGVQRDTDALRQALAGP